MVREYTDFFIIIIAWCVVISFKYGYYCPENFDLFRNSKLTDHLIERQYIVTCLYDWRPEGVARKIRKTIDCLDIREESFTLKVFKDLTEMDVANPEEILSRLVDSSKQVVYFKKFEAAIASGSIKEIEDFRSVYFRSNSD